jgi:hypothetical protein
MCTEYKYVLQVVRVLESAFFKNEHIVHFFTSPKRVIRTCTMNLFLLLASSLFYHAAGFAPHYRMSGTRNSGTTLMAMERTYIMVSTLGNCRIFCFLFASFIFSIISDQTGWCTAWNCRKHYFSVRNQGIQTSRHENQTSNKGTARSTLQRSCFQTFLSKDEGLHVVGTSKY